MAERGISTVTGNGPDTKNCQIGQNILNLLKRHQKYILHWF